MHYRTFCVFIILRPYNAPVARVQVGKRIHSVSFVQYLLAIYRRTQRCQASLFDRRLVYSLMSIVMIVCATFRLG